MEPIQLCCVKDHEVSQAVNSQGQVHCSRSLHAFICPVAHTGNGSLSGRGTNYRKSMYSLNSQHSTYLSLFRSLTCLPILGASHFPPRPVAFITPYALSLEGNPTRSNLNGKHWMEIICTCQHKQVNKNSYVTSIAIAFKLCWCIWPDFKFSCHWADAQCPRCKAATSLHVLFVTGPSQMSHSLWIACTWLMKSTSLMKWEIKSHNFTVTSRFFYSKNMASEYPIQADKTWRGCLKL